MFLIQGALATSAMIVLKPLQSIARIASPFTTTNRSYDRLVFLHTANPDIESNNRVVQYIKEIKNNYKNTILLKARQGGAEDSSSLPYDASLNDGIELPSITDEYKIIKKNHLRTGIIYARYGEDNVIEKINTLSTFLKKEKKCKLVVCLSGLGYKNKNTPDDITLAGKSTHVDIIIGGHPENFHKLPIITLNSNNAEVIIHAAAGDPAPLGKIEIDFDETGRKNNINFIHEL